MKPVILGAGLAGLATALSLAPMPVLLVSPCTLGEGCCSAWAQGGIAAATGLDDRPEWHAADTLAAGNGLNDVSVVRQVTNDGPTVIARLTERGVRFDRDADGALTLALEAAHKKRRVAHVRDETGKAIMEALVAAVRRTPSIEIAEKSSARCLESKDGSVTGVTLQRGTELAYIQTNCIVLATGGAAALWRDTTNPHENWGSGLALAARAGATLRDLEFMQFHPTALDGGRDPMPLVSEALRGEGAVLINETDARFIDELLPRDIVARAISNEFAHGHRVFLDARRALGARLINHFPTIYRLCMSCNVDPTLVPIPVRPAAHFHMGGVLTDASGRTDVTGLWACGEVACTGLNGANRLASNSLLEAASFAHKIAEDIKGTCLVPVASTANLPTPNLQKPATDEEAKIRTVMTECVGVVRNRSGLTRAVNYFSRLSHTSDMGWVGLMIAQAALQREESRGSHYRDDFPRTLEIAHHSHFSFTDRKDS